MALRLNQRLTYDRIAERVGLSRSAIARALAKPLVRLDCLRCRTRCPCGVAAEAGESHRADLRLSRLFGPGVQQAYGSDTRSPSAAAEQALRLFGELNKIESEARTVETSQRLRHRQEKARPLAESLHARKPRTTQLAPTAPAK